jgi:lichenan operon transcriptional antiterminator
MTTREKKILELLYRSSKELTTTELANSLHISSRTIKSDIQKIKTLLKSTGCEIHTQAGKGLWISYDENGRNFLDSMLLHNSAPESYAPEVRRYYIALQLLDSDDYVSMESISNSLFISQSTVVNELNRMDDFFDRQGLKLERKVKYGVRIQGDEKHLRIAKANVIRSIIVSQGNNASDKLQPFFEGIDLAYINSILQESEEHFGYVLADTSYSEMITHLAIIIKRVKRGKNCAIDTESLSHFQNRDEYRISAYIGQRLEEMFGITLTDGDITYICMNLSAAKLLRDIMMTTNDFSVLDTGSALQALETWNRIIGQVSDMYGENLLDDNTFKAALFVHFNGMFKRLSNNIYLENPMKDMIKEELTYEMEVATYMAGLLQMEYHLELGENEICDIALYIGASLERTRAQRKIMSSRVIIACGTGMGTSHFVEAKLKSYFPDMVILKIIPASRMELNLEHEEERPDFIISTVPLQSDHIKVVQISPLLNENDINKIKSAIHTPTRKQEHKPVLYKNLFPLMSDSISILKCDCRSKEEAIEFLGNRLYREGFVDSGYVDAVFQRENISPTAIGCTFAIPHAFGDHVKKQGIGLMTLRHPIPWGNEEKVQIILMLSIDVKLGDQFKDIFSDLANLTKNMDAVNRLLKAERFSDIMKIANM